MKLTDYVIEFLANEGVDCVFGVTGGAVVHLFDSADRNGKMRPVFCHHEQAAALAAVSYARVKNTLGLAIVTTGPGGTNALTGLCAAWLDSIPCVFISGQARFEHTTKNKPIRQVGSQQIDIVSIVKPMTKYAVMVEDAKMIKYHLQKAVAIAKSGRPGPVWIDLPLNFQWASVEVDELKSFDVVEIIKQPPSKLPEKLYKEVYELLRSAQRPLIVAGYGIRLAGAVDDFRRFIEKTKVPFVCTWNTSDLLSSDDPCYMGRMGIAGQRGANLTVQNCDLLISIGSHLCMTLTGSRFDAFARGAKKIVVDIDPAELEHANIKIDMRIESDAKDFLVGLQNLVGQKLESDISPWHEKCARYRSYNEVDAGRKLQKDFIDPYVFIDLLSDELVSEDTIVVDGGGTALYMPFQAFKVKRGQRMVVSGGIAAMGTGLPESVGACFANQRRRTICFIGDGSMQFNIHELQTIVHHQLPIKIIVFNNQGYLAMRHTQDGFLKSRYVGSDSQGGLSLPDYQKVASAYGIIALRVANYQEAAQKIKMMLDEQGPVVCEIMIPPDQQLIPTVGFKKNPDGTATGMPLEDMFPHLPREEFLKNMIVAPLKESL